jgi:hypothetical protein
VPAGPAKIRGAGGLAPTGALPPRPARRANQLLVCHMSRLPGRPVRARKAGAHSQPAVPHGR